jgi:hypothetical protein
VGLANIRERLAALYGDAARLTIEANEPQGVRATLEVPRAAPTADGASKATAASDAAGAPARRKSAAARTLAAVGSAERAWRKSLSFAFVVLVALAAVVAGLAFVGIVTGVLHLQIGEELLGGTPGALLGAAGITFAFVAVVAAVAVVLAVVYGLGFLFAGLAIFVPLVVLVALFPVLAPFILVGLVAWWVVRRVRRRA